MDVHSPEALQRICQRCAKWLAGAGRGVAVAGGGRVLLGAPHVALYSPAIFSSTILSPRRSNPCPGCSLEGPVVVRKGAGDAVGDGRRVVVCQEEGSPRRAGGQVRKQVAALGCCGAGVQPRGVLPLGAQGWLL